VAARNVKSLSGVFQIGRTEVIRNSLKPDFVKKFVMEYLFQESQKLKFELYVPLVTILNISVF
jgi:hypothetical protein